MYTLGKAYKKDFFMGFENKRFYKRATCQILAGFENTNLQNPHFYKATISDISQGGIGCSLRFHFPYFKEKYVRFNLSACNPTTVKVERVWTRWNAHKFCFDVGLRFVDLGAEYRHHINEFVEKHLPTPGFV